MSDMMGKVGGFFAGLKKKAGDALEEQQISLIRGKTAARAVYTDAGEMIVDAGRPIDEPAIEIARGCGKLGALVASVASSSAQDLRDKARSAYAATAEGQEARTLASSDQYIEARGYIGWIASSDVTDIRGNVIVSAGQKIDDEHVRAAREADQLSSLIYSAQQSGRPYPTAAPPPPKGLPINTPPSPAVRAARPLASYYDDEVGEGTEAHQ